MNFLVSYWKALFDSLPDIVSFVLAAVSLCLLFTPELSARLDKHKKTRLLLAAVIFLLGIGAIISNKRQKAAEKEAKEIESQNERLERDRLQKQISDLQEQQGKTQQELDSARKVVLESREAQLGVLTGADSFCYLTFDGTTPQTQGIPFFSHVGKNPIQDVTARVVDLKRFSEEISSGRRKTLQEFLTKETYIRIGNLYPGAALPVMQPLTFSDSEKQDFNIFFSGNNGFWSQELRLRWNGKRWLHATRVKKSEGKTEKLIFERVDKDFPRNEKGKVDY